MRGINYTKYVDRASPDYGQTSSVTKMIQSLHWRRLDQRRIDNKLSLMYKITHNLIAIPFSDFLIPRVRPSRQYHPLSYRLTTATTDYYKFSFFPRAVFDWNGRRTKAHRTKPLTLIFKEDKSPHIYFIRRTKAHKIIFIL